MSPAVRDSVEVQQAALALVEAAHDLFTIQFRHWERMTPADKERLGNLTGCCEPELDRIAARWADYCRAIGRPDLLNPGYFSSMAVGPLHPKRVPWPPRQGSFGMVAGGEVKIHQPEPWHIRLLDWISEGPERQLGATIVIALGVGAAVVVLATIIGG